MGKRRLDMLLLERGLFDSREKARVAVMAGSVLVNDSPAVKPASLVDETSRLSLVERPRYVSRGGDKMEHAPATSAAAAANPVPSVSRAALASTRIAGSVTRCAASEAARASFSASVGTLASAAASSCGVYGTISNGGKLPFSSLFKLCM